MRLTAAILIAMAFPLVAADAPIEGAFAATRERHPELPALGQTDIHEMTGLPLVQLLGRRFTGIATVDILRDQPLVFFTAPDSRNAGREERIRAAHLISGSPSSYFAGLREGGKVKVEAMIVEEGYGALFMYVYSAEPVGDSNLTPGEGSLPKK